MMYKRNNITAIPILRNSKLPEFHWRQWCDTLPTFRHLRVWFDYETKNIAILCGGINNLVVLDFDNMQLYDDWLNKCFRRDDEWELVAEDAYRVITARGVHVYVRTPERIPNRKLKIGIDIKSHGTYVLVPPSIHPDGWRYQPEGEFHLILVNNIGDVIDIPPVEVPKSPDFGLIIDYDKNIHSCNDRIETIKQAIPMLDYCNSLTQMERKSSGRFWYGKCINPSHADHHPSFRVDTQNNLCTCLSPACILNEEQHGIDVIELHARLYNMSTKDAIHDLYNTIIATI